MTVQCLRMNQRLKQFTYDTNDVGAVALDDRTPDLSFDWNVNQWYVDHSILNNTITIPIIGMPGQGMTGGVTLSCTGDGVTSLCTVKALKVTREGHFHLAAVDIRSDEWCYVRGIGEYKSLSLSVPFAGNILMELALRVCEAFGKKKQYLEDEARVPCGKEILLTTPLFMWTRDASYYMRFGFQPCPTFDKASWLRNSGIVFNPDDVDLESSQSLMCVASQKLRGASMEDLMVEVALCPKAFPENLPDVTCSEDLSIGVGECMDLLRGKCSEQSEFLGAFMDMRGSATKGFPRWNARGIGSLTVEDLTRCPLVDAATTIAAATHYCRSSDACDGVMCPRSFCK